MRTRLILLATSLTLLPVLGGAVLAAQLDGLQMHPTGNKLEVILDIDDKGQGYQIHKAPNAGYNILLPKAKLPESFQDTGLPPVASPDGTTIADVKQVSEGVLIRIQGSKADNLPCEVRFKASGSSSSPTPKSPLALLKPDKQEMESLFTQVSQGLTPKAPIIAKAKPTRPQAMAKKPVRPIAVAAVPKAPIPVKPTATVSAPETVVVQPAATVKGPLAKAKPEVIASALPKATLKPSTLQKPLAESAKTKPERLQVAKADGFGFLGQAQERAEPETEPNVYLPEQEPEERVEAFPPTFSKDAYGSKLGLKEASKKPGGPFSGTIFRWIFVSVALVGILILAAVGLATWARRRMTPQTTTLEANLRPPVEEYFEEPPVPIVTAPEPETYMEVLARERAKQTQHPPVSESRMTPPQASQPRSAITPTPPKPSVTPVKPAQKPVAALPPVAKTPKPMPKPPVDRPVRSVTPPENLFVQPSRSVSEAVKSSLGSKASPYISAPFRIPTRPANAQGGPTPKRSAFGRS